MTYSGDRSNSGKFEHLHFDSRAGFDIAVHQPAHAICGVAAEADLSAPITDSCREMLHQHRFAIDDEHLVTRIPGAVLSIRKRDTETWLSPFGGPPVLRKTQGLAEYDDCWVAFRESSAGDYPQLSSQAANPMESSP